MVETLTIKIDTPLKQALLERSRLLNEDVDTIVNRVLKDFVEQSMKSCFASPLRSELEQFDDINELSFVRDFLSKYRRDGSEMLPCGLTLDEYMSLDEAEREEMWEEAYRRELDKRPESESEKEANPNAIPAGQGDSAEMRRRLRQLSEQRKAYC